MALEIRSLRRRGVVGIKSAKERGMDTLNSAAFSLFGLLMGFIPALLPAYFTSTGVDGSNHSELWLEFMGVLQWTLGTFYFIRNEVLPQIMRLFSWKTWSMSAAALTEQPQPGIILRPTAMGYSSVPDSGEHSLAA